MVISVSSKGRRTGGGSSPISGFSLRWIWRFDMIEHRLASLYSHR